VHNTQLLHFDYYNKKNKNIFTFHFHENGFIYFEWKSVLSDYVPKTFAPTEYEKTHRKKNGASQMAAEQQQRLCQ